MHNGNRVCYGEYYLNFIRFQGQYIFKLDILNIICTLYGITEVLDAQCNKNPSQLVS